MKNYKILFYITGYFGICAVSGYFLGVIIDSYFGIKPAGTIISFLLSYVVSWGGLILYLKKKKNNV